MGKSKKSESGPSMSSNVIDKHQFAQIRAKKASPLISKREVDKIFSTADAQFELAVQRDISAFGSLIRNLRREAGFTQAQLSKVSRVSRGTIANLEAGILDGGPRLGTLAALARACGKQLVPNISPLLEPAAENNRKGAT